MSKRLIDIIKEQVMEKVIDKTNCKIGNDLSTGFLNVLQIKEILYTTLMNIEIQEIKDKYGNYHNSKEVSTKWKRIFVIDVKKK